MIVYWPTSGLRLSSGKILGWRKGDDICVIAIVREWPCTELASNLDQLRTQRSDDVGVIGDASEDPPRRTSEQYLVFHLNKRRIPISCNIPVQIILFTPPDHVRLRFLTLDVGDRKGKAEGGVDGDLDLGKQDDYGIGAGREDTGGVEDVIPLLNDVMRVQRLLSSSTHSQRSIRPIGLLGRFSYIGGYGWKGSYRIRELCPLWLVRVLKLVVERSNTAQQLSLRLSQIVQARSALIGTTRRPGVRLDTRSKRYMRFWNTVWLILNDLILGYCARQILVQVSRTLEKTLTASFQKHLINDVVVILRWLNDWPVGLKLNTSLSAFFCASLSTGIQAWGSYIIPLLQRHSGMVLCITANSGWFGLTLLLAVIHDMFGLLSLHLRVCNLVMAGLCQWQLASLSGLWNLFRGKRWNDLRGRMDSYAYDVDQLFLGTLLFTVSAFLFPTVLTYTALFASINVGLTGIGGILSTIRGGLNVFPLFEILLRVKEPSRLPAGITFDLVKVYSPKDSLSSGSQPLTGIIHALHIRNQPKNLFEILWPKS